jgi:SAM-dependent methyltransferase
MIIPYAKPYMVSSLEECAFYQTIELPGFGVQRGAWDLRDGVDDYLSATDYSGKRVLEVGTANGFVCFELERRGAEVVAFDLDEKFSYDIIPAHGLDVDARMHDQAEGLRKVRNAYWLAHELFKSEAKAVYGHVNRLPLELGRFDVGFVGNVLQHLENPFGAIARISKLCDTIVITEATWVTSMDQELPLMYFLPELKKDQDPWEWCFSWWQVTPGLLKVWLRVLGYRVQAIQWHEQMFTEIETEIPHFTMVFQRI